MTSHEAPTISATATRPSPPHATGGRRRSRTLHDSERSRSSADSTLVAPAVADSTVASAAVADSTLAAPAPGLVRSAGRFLALAARPVRVGNEAVSVLLSALVFGGLWAGLTFVAAPGVRHVTAQTPFGPHELTVAVSRVPWGIAIACVLGAARLLIAGIRVTRDAARRS